MTHVPRLLATMLLPLILVGAMAACGTPAVTQVVPIAMELPRSEAAVYQLHDKSGAVIGQATLTIAPEGDASRLSQQYAFTGDQTDQSVTLVDQRSMRPQMSERTVVDRGVMTTTAARYEPDRVSVSLRAANTDRTRSAAISETAYDNLESLFLWRTMAMGAGERLSYVNVVVDPRRGTISRALATVAVSGREEVRLPSGTVEAWRVDFTSAGVTNQAWYRVDGTRQLVKYAIARGPTLILDRVIP